MAPRFRGGGGATGVIFELAPPTTPGGAWAETVLYEFGPSDANPNGPLLFGPGGSIYTTNNGGGSGFGQVSALLPPATPGAAWTEDDLYSFVGSPEGRTPEAGVVTEGGSLFGTTLIGGDEFCGGGGVGCGVVYELTAPTAPGGAWTGTNIHTFTGPPSDGAEPEGLLAIGADGTLYGTTYYGGPYICADPSTAPNSAAVPFSS